MNNIDELFNKIMKTPPKFVNVTYHTHSDKIVNYVAEFNEEYICVNSSLIFRPPYDNGINGNQLDLGQARNVLLFKQSAIKAYFDKEIKDIIDE